MQTAAGQLPQVPVLRVIRNVALEEDDEVPARRKRTAETAPQGGVAVSPRGTDCQAEDDEFHADARVPCNRCACQVGVCGGARLGVRRQRAASVRGGIAVAPSGRAYGTRYDAQR